MKTAAVAPAGTQVATLSYDAAAVASSVVAALVTASGSSSSASGPDIDVSSLDIVNPEDRDSTNNGLQRRSGGAVLPPREFSSPIDTSSAAVPSGYDQVFANLTEVTQANGYMTYKTLTAYSTSSCATACDKLNTCIFSSIYHESDPDANSKSVDTIKCSLYSLPQTSATATNVGQ